MNKYQLEVAEYDRRHGRTTRVLSAGGAACVVVLALWSAGLPPTQWWARLSALFEPAHAQQQAASSPSKTKAPPPVLPDANAPIRVYPGTQSSTSETPRPLLLVSTELGRHSRDGSAMIGVDASNPQRYAAGSMLINGARLDQIFRDHVILVRGTQSLRLDLVAGAPKKTLGADDLRMVSATPLPETPKRRAPRISDVILFMPSYNGDAMEGIQVLPGKHKAVFSQLGLQPRDIIVSMNGTALTDDVAAKFALESVAQGVAVEAVIRRAEAWSTISIDGQVLAHALTETEPNAVPAAMASADTPIPDPSRL